MPEQQIAGVEGFLFKIGAVTGNQEPMPDHAPEQFNAPERGELAAELAIGGIRGFGQHQPESVVPRRLRMVADMQTRRSPM